MDLDKTLQRLDDAAQSGDLLHDLTTTRAVLREIIPLVKAMDDQVARLTLQVHDLQQGATEHSKAVEKLIAGQSDPRD